MNTSQDSSTTPPPAPGRSRRNRGSEVVRDRLIDAAIAEFAAHGFEGASTRSIAEAADAHQSQVRYHFETKDELWRQAHRRLLDELDSVTNQHLGDVEPTDVRGVLTALIRGLVEFASVRPELSRIMMHEATNPSDRLSWIVETQVERRQRHVVTLWQQLQEQGRVAAIDADLLYHTIVGAASLLYANAPEAKLLGIDATDPDLVRRHADALITILLPPNPPCDQESDQGA